MSTDEQNLLSCLIAKRLGVGNTIARVRNPEYTSGCTSFRTTSG